MYKARLLTGFVDQSCAIFCGIQDFPYTFPIGCKAAEKLDAALEPVKTANGEGSVVPPGQIKALETAIKEAEAILPSY